MEQINPTNDSELVGLYPVSLIQQDTRMTYNRRDSDTCILQHAEGIQLLVLNNKCVWPRMQFMSDVDAHGMHIGALVQPRLNDLSCGHAEWP